MIHGDPTWTKERINRNKRDFLDVLEQIHFPGLACKRIGIDEKTMQIWMRTDPNFADQIRAIQLRTGERIGAKLLQMGFNGDLGALAILLKQLGPHFKMVSQEAVDMSAAAVSGMDISKLSLEEQDTILRLMRKAQDSTASTTPTRFIEEAESTTFLEHEINDDEVEEATDEEVSQFLKYAEEEDNLRIDD
jgi:hypothetical protein